MTDPLTDQYQFTAQGAYNAGAPPYPDFAQKGSITAPIKGAGKGGKSHWQTYGHLQVTQPPFPQQPRSYSLNTKNNRQQQRQQAQQQRTQQPRQNSRPPTPVTAEALQVLQTEMNDTQYTTEQIGFLNQAVAIINSKPPPPEPPLTSTQAKALLDKANHHYSKCHQELDILLATCKVALEDVDAAETKFNTITQQEHDEHIAQQNKEIAWAAEQERITAQNPDTISKMLALLATTTDRKNWSQETIDAIETLSTSNAVLLPILKNVTESTAASSSTQQLQPSPKAAPTKRREDGTPKLQTHFTDDDDMPSNQTLTAAATLHIEEDDADIIDDDTEHIYKSTSTNLTLTHAEIITQASQLPLPTASSSPQPSTIPTPQRSRHASRSPTPTQLSRQNSGTNTPRGTH